MHNLTAVLTRSFALAAVAGGALFAQQVQIADMKWVAEGMEGPTVTGKPYSATAITTSSQTLGDGTKISRTTQVSMARDSEGRTRREQSVNNVGPWASNAKAPMVTIRDPVAQVRYMLQPDGQTAVKSSMTSFRFTVNGPDGVRVTNEVDETKRAAEVKARAMITSDMKARTEKAISEGGAVTVSRDGANVGYSVVLSGEGKAQTEDLGTRVIEGINAKGHRETRTIPVGDIGNDRPIQIVSEIWVSDDLQTVVLSKRSDPRVGESEYKLTNISRNEPARTLFEVPAGYTIKEEGSRERRREE